MSNEYNYSLLKKCGEDVFISSNVEIRRPHLVSLGSHIAIDTGFYCTTGAEFGDYIHLGPYSTVIGGPDAILKLDHFSGFAAGCRIICASDEHMGYGLIGPRSIPDEFKDKIISEPVVFEKFARAGSNVVIMPGVVIGEGCVIGANSLVTKSTEPWTVYFGSPAKAIKIRPKDNLIEYAKKLGYSV